MPIYKVQDYLDECVHSILGQTHHNLEVLLVDDGSPDRCPEICDVYAAKDSRVKVIHKKNGGLSSARNAGLKEATGDYIGFVDSDDWIAEDMYEKLLAAFSCSENLGIVSGMFHRVWMDGSLGELRENWVSQPVCVVNNKELPLLVAKEEISHTAWNKLYKRECIGDITFGMVVTMRIGRSCLNSRYV